MDFNDPVVQAMIMQILYGQGQEQTMANFIGPGMGEPLINTLGGGWNTEKDGSPDYGANLTDFNKVRSGYADHANAALVGPGAYAPGSFQAQEIYEDVTDQTPFIRASQWVDPQTGQLSGGIEGIAARGAREGETPSEIQGYVNTLYQLKDKDSEEYQTLRAESGNPFFDEDWDTIQESMFKYDNFDNGLSATAGSQSDGKAVNTSQLNSTIDTVWNDVKQAEQYFNGMRGPDNPEGQFFLNPATGTLQTVTTEPTEAMEWYDDKGLSYPDQQYDYQHFVNNSPELQAFEQNRSGAEAQLALMKKQLFDRSPAGSDTAYAGNLSHTPITEEQRQRIDTRNDLQSTGGRGTQAGNVEPPKVDLPDTYETVDDYLDTFATAPGPMVKDPDGPYPSGPTVAPGELDTTDELKSLAESMLGTDALRSGNSRLDVIRGMADRSNAAADSKGSGSGFESTYGYDYGTDKRKKLFSQYASSLSDHSNQQSRSVAAGLRAQNLQAAGRTPLGDELQQRAMSMFLGGGLRGY